MQMPKERNLNDQLIENQPPALTSVNGILANDSLGLEIVTQDDRGKELIRAKDELLKPLLKTLEYPLFDTLDTTKEVELNKMLALRIFDELPLSNYCLIQPLIQPLNALEQWEQSYGDCEDLTSWLGVPSDDDSESDDMENPLEMATWES